VLSAFALELSKAKVIERFVGRSPGVMLEAIEAHLGRRLPDRLESYEHRYAPAFEAELAAVDEGNRGQNWFASEGGHPLQLHRRSRHAPRAPLSAQGRGVITDAEYQGQRQRIIETI
jgi:hypothetical protein